MKKKVEERLLKVRKSGAFRHSSNYGSTPGTMSAHPDSAQYSLKLNVIAFSDAEFVEAELKEPAEIQSYLQKYPVTWLSVYGLGQVDKLKEIAEIFKFHSLAMEDVVNTHQRPKVEEYGETMFSVIRMPSMLEDGLYLEQVSIFWSEKFVVAFMEKEGDCLDPLRVRIKSDERRHNLLLPEYLGYSILDTIVDSYFPLLEIYGMQLDDIEEDAIANPSRKIVIRIHEYKHDLAAIRRTMWSEREALRNLLEVAKFSHPEMKFFIRDCEDHTIQLIDILENYRERTSGLMDLYLSSVNNKMNEIMKILTMIATITLPISAVAGIYGMNFDRSHPWNMPELSWEYGYLYALGIMLFIAITQFYFFWRRGWLHPHP